VFWRRMNCHFVGIIPSKFSEDVSSIKFSKLSFNGNNVIYKLNFSIYNFIHKVEVKNHWVIAGSLYGLNINWWLLLALALPSPISAPIYIIPVWITSIGFKWNLLVVRIRIGLLFVCVCLSILILLIRS